MFEFTIGVGQVIKGWDEGVILMSAGERATLTISSDFGYGASGSPPVIPGGADLCFDVELVAINGKKAFYTQEEKDKFTAQMNVWKEKQIAKFDDDEAFKAKKLAKFETEDAFRAFVDKSVAEDIAAVTVR